MTNALGDREYEFVPGWGKLPDDWEPGEVAAVAVDSADNVHVLARTDHPYQVFDKSGMLIDDWGRGIIDEGHGICIGPDDSAYVVDRVAQQVLKFDASGRHRLTIGQRGQASDTGYVEQSEHDDPYTHGSLTNGVQRSAGPFNVPTGAAIGPDGSIFVSDGYRNARIHKFDPQGVLITSWGEPGSARELRDTTAEPGKFHNPHNLAVLAELVFVADRQNCRIQVFDLDGAHVTTWLGFLRPSDIQASPREGLLYVSEMEDRVTVIDLDGQVVAQVATERSSEPGKFWGPHGISVDSEGSIYVAEVFAGRVQKLARVS
jgi:NHL repeat